MHSLDSSIVKTASRSFSDQAMRFGGGTQPGAALSGPCFCLTGRGGHLGGPATKWGGRGRPAGHAAVLPAVPR
jgi:hypothetical protein